MLLSILSFATSVSYTTIGSSSLTIPNGVVSINVKLWGAGGAGFSAHNVGIYTVDSVYAGGGGAFVSCNMAVTGGTTIYLLVGQGGQVPSYGANSAAATGGGGNSIFIREYANINIIVVLNLSSSIRSPSHRTGIGMSGHSDVSAGGGGGRTAIQLTNGVDAVVAGGGGGGAGCYTTPSVTACSEISGM